MEKKAFMTLERLSGITRTYPTPFYLYDEKGIRENAKRPREAFSWNQGFRKHLTAKAASNLFLSQILREYRCGTDCSSMTELMTLEANGFHGEETIFSSSDMPMEGFQYTHELGTTINLDDITHIVCLGEAVGEIPEIISCRYNPGGPFKINNGIMNNPGDAKYGMTMGQLSEAFRILKDKGAKRLGIHTFLANNTVMNEYYPMLAKAPFEVAVKLKEEAGVGIRFINPSGGIGIPYRPDQEPSNIRVIGEGVKQVREEVLVLAGLGDVTLYTELSRFMIGSYGCLMTKAIHKKHTHERYVGVDVYVVSLMRSTMYGTYHHIMVVGKEQQPCGHKYDVVGSLRENNDKFVTDRMLLEIKKGDLPMIHDIGVHGFSVGYNYDGKLEPVELSLKEDDSVQMIRRMETVKDYFATFDSCDMLKEYEW